MAVAANEFFGHPSEELEVAGVTGTNGKTTTAYLLYAVLDAAGRRPGLLGTVETRVGDERRPAVRTTAEAIDLQRTLREMVDAGNRSCALEATSHGAALHRLDGLRFAVLVFTNLTQDHLDFHGTMDEYFAAKRGLFARRNAGRRQRRRPLRPQARRRAARRAHVRFRRRRASRRPEALAGVELKLRGRFNVENALGALAAARLLGIDDATALAGIAVGARRAGTLRGGRRGAAVHRARRLRPHAGRARERPRARPASSAGG